MDSFQSLSCPKTSTIKEQNNHSPKEDGETYSLSEIRKYEKWLIELGEIGGKPELCTNDGVVHVNQISPQYRFIESEKRISESTVNIAYTSSRDYTDQNASINSTYDTHFTHQQQGNSHGILHSCSILSAPQHVPDDKGKEIGNYSKASRISESENNTEYEILISNILRDIEMTETTLGKQNDIRNSTSIVASAREEYREASDVSNRDAIFDYGICMPKSFETNKIGIFSHHRYIPSSMGGDGNCCNSLGPRNDDLQGNLKHDSVPQKHVLLSIQISDRNKPCSEISVPVNNMYNPSSTTSKVHLDDRRFICKECGNSFRHKCTLVTHYRTHTGEKPFACNLCEKRFSQSINLAVHRRTHTGERPFGCDVCRKRFKLSCTLARHRLTHTGEKPFGCDVCEKRFRQSTTLARHRRTHTGEKPFGCDVCRKRFRQSSTLARHRRTHTGEKPFGCDMFEKRFNDRGNLIKHRISHLKHKQ